MALRDSLHRMVDDLPDIESAPDDDEAETPQESAAVNEAWREQKEGKSLSTEELKRELGLS